MSLALEIRLFGPLDVRLNGASLTLVHSHKEQWLLALLILRQGRPVDRAWLAGTLWPESDPSRALDNLRHTLAALRKALGPEAHRLLAPTRRTLTLDLDGAAVDLLEFDAAVAAEGGDLQRAIALYRGPLLEGCTEEWATQDRHAREHTCLNALETLAAHALALNDHAAAMAPLRRLVAIDPLRESAHRDLMRTLLALGDHAAARRAYRDLQLQLLAELDSTPDDQTAALYAEICAQDRAHPAAPLLPHTSTPPASRRLPRPLTGLVGREQELRDLLALIASTRLLTLTGAGGIGKTRLALYAARQLSHTDPQHRHHFPPPYLPGG